MSTKPDLSKLSDQQLALFIAGFRASERCFFTANELLDYAALRLRRRHK